MSPRTLITWAENSCILDDIDYAFKLTFLNKCDEAERGIISEYFQRCFARDLPKSWTNFNDSDQALNTYKKSQENQNFKKSIKSTIKAISEQKNLNIFFGDLDETKKQDILLPSFNDTSEKDKIMMIREMSDSASLKKIS